MFAEMKLNIHMKTYCLWEFEKVLRDICEPIGPTSLLTWNFSYSVTEFVFTHTQLLTELWGKINASAWQDAIPEPDALQVHVVGHEAPLLGQGHAIVLSFPDRVPEQVSEHLHAVGGLGRVGLYHG